jgi:putative flippase GtrA
MKIIIKSFFAKFFTLIIKYQLFVLYAIIGAFCASLDFSIFTILIYYLSINYLIANIISVNLGILTSFTLNRQFNFKVKNRPLKRFAVFYTVGLLGLFIGSAFLWLSVEVFNVKVLVSKIIVIMIITVIQFSLNKLITFKIN